MASLKPSAARRPKGPKVRHTWFGHDYNKKVGKPAAGQAMPASLTKLAAVRFELQLLPRDKYGPIRARGRSSGGCREGRFPHVVALSAADGWSLPLGAFLLSGAPRPMFCPSVI